MFCLIREILAFSDQVEHKYAWIIKSMVLSVKLATSFRKEKLRKLRHVVSSLIR